MTGVQWIEGDRVPERNSSTERIAEMLVKTNKSHLPTRGITDFHKKLYSNISLDFNKLQSTIRGWEGRVC